MKIMFFPLDAIRVVIKRCRDPICIVVKYGRDAIHAQRIFDNTLCIWYGLLNFGIHFLHVFGVVSMFLIITYIHSRPYNK
jgi:hypothetical protein